ncbi:MAG: T9SS type A sorting domain-containing protein [Chryseobacterium sp.]|uniref:T9SS type A sorting domain-containing protein n=1 Tax=Chryseobacterium sp. TaxID=1871047 RepID=UPI001B154FC3|nr:T9SS type A sorting domain-containing protein [Chryseobacterium sp.]MBO6186671.1 T9SS type A sorting domain-containing protein [Chryseobacterium sp.]
MKKIYLVIFLIMCIVSNAQIVNIPDANFKAYLLSANTTNYIALDANNNPIVINSNGDNEIQLSEASLVKTLDISGSSSTVGSQIGSIVGIKSFVNVSKLSVQDISNNSFTFFDVSGMTSLTDLFATGYYISGFNVDNCTSLTKISIYGGNFQTLTLNVPSLTNLSIVSDLTSLNFQGCPNIKFLTLENIRLNTINLNGIANLEEVKINYGIPWLNNTINISNNPHLKKLNFYGSNVQSLTVSNNPLLTDITSNYTTSVPIVTITNNAILKNISLVDSSITNLTLTGSPLLETFDVEGNSLTNINLTGFPVLKTVKCSDNQLTSINLSSNPLVMYLDCSYNNLQIINFKNGGTISFPYNFNIGNNVGLKYLCCDLQDITTAQNYLNMYGYSNVNVNSYCSFTPGGIFYTINGNTRFDSNNNGCDILDLGKAFQNILVSTGTSNANFISNATGTHFIPLTAGIHTITPALENPTYFNVSPTSLSVNFPTQTSPITQNFCLTANGNHNDLEVVILPITAASPGFDATYKIVYKNKGTTTQAGTFVFNYNDNLMNFLNATVAPNSQTTGILNWNFTNLLPFEAREITVILKLNTPTQTPALTGGDILHYTAQINGTTDETPADNIFTLNQTVVNSFDPNDKTCLEGTAITQAKVGDYVHYLIRFENTGTANAQNIVVKDEIDISKYDLSSLVALNASHSFVTRITGNAVEFIFENIQLPFNNATNDGYVSFKIKTKSNLTLGDSFSNTAKIYFDYNHPIITNTYTTTVQNVLSTSEISNDKTELSIYPNPVKDVLNIQSKNQIVKAEIYDVNGRILVSTSLNGNSIHVSELPKGNYIIKLFSKDKATAHKFIKN